jgi:hypothetical protein
LVNQRRGIFNLSIRCGLVAGLQHRPARQDTKAWQDANAFTEKRMKSLSDMAARYDEWANEHETTAREILASLDSFAREIRENQRWRASWLMADAAKLKAKAAELRKVERQSSMNYVSPTIALGIFAKS